MQAWGDRSIALESQARAFGEELRDTFLETVESDLEEFDYTVTDPTEGPPKATLRSIPRPRVTLYSEADGDLVPTFGIGISFGITLGEFLIVEESSIHVGLGTSERDEPIFRYEYQRHQDEKIPVAHLHVHGHRDEFVHGMLLSSTGKAKQRSQDLARKRLRATRPTMSQVHFPLGGPRLRPGIEDVLHLLISEFGIATKPKWKLSLENRRSDWRKLQLRTLVRRNPHLAAEVLNDMDDFEVISEGREETAPDYALWRF